MFTVLFVSCTATLFTYTRKVFMLLGLFGLLSCKDFKSWDSKYACRIQIKFEPAMDELVPGKYSDLHTPFILTDRLLPEPEVDQEFNPKWYPNGRRLLITLRPDVNQVKVKLEGVVVLISYECVLSLISPEVGGFQAQYLINNIEFIPTDSSRVFLKKFEIKNPTPLSTEEKTHVTIFY